ncbi:crosslink repair DNA glycosylase YcaQ family protein [Bacillus carboniphilus]|uniref:Crosslink repair DNA glycosylase YcaQ family protein n=1 Tax=Bacillus carboniphilus TaxID=86663 RepID=A0ABY9JYA6_9BACI|nr:crosslink repair DNA glycosylase YcaQ family protein [Bacillus carboniphilus]WLR42575.1 crosslink repair DNA glycosylase YcaQ family protein [Bacillus carboniphilus]
MGMIWARNGGGWLGHFLYNKSIRQHAIDELLSENQIVVVKVEGIKDDFYIKREDIELLRNVEDIPNKEIRFLAPLDNLLWDRLLVEKLFNFNYRWEVYVPKDKRRFGYYVLPVLYGDQLIARFEPEHNRGNEPLQIKNWWWEEGIEITNELEGSVLEACERFCNYLGVRNISEDSRMRIFSQK